MRILSTVLSVYSFIIFLSILLSWIPSRSSRLMRIKLYINQITNPYLNIFRGIQWLRIGNLDLSPLLALLILYFGIYITDNMASLELLSGWDLLFWLVWRIWIIVTGVFLLFAIIMLFRLLMLYVSRRPSLTFLSNLDSFLFPVVSRTLGLFTNRTIPYPWALGIVAGAFIAVRFLGRWGMALLLEFLRNLLNSL